MLAEEREQRKLGAAPIEFSPTPQGVYESGAVTGDE